MRVLIFGATGMVGQGVLRECLLDPNIEAVQTVGRSATGAHHLKLQEFVQPDLFHYSGIEARLKGYHACFFCLGVSSGGMSEQQYENLTYTAAYMFRPGVIQPVQGARSKTTAYRVGYALAKPILPLLRRLFPRYILTTEEIGRAMIHVAK
jgi:uncharacterized protein YbjT (DUF2867 family)